MTKLLNHINTYQSEADYKNDKSKNFPNVSYIVENDNVLFVKEKTDYSKQYLTFVALEDSTFKLKSNAVNYSLDDGHTWTTLASGTASPTVTAGNKIMWKGTCTPTSDIGIGKFSATANFNVQGNIMSLLFGDDFTNKTDLTGKDYAFYDLFYQNTNIKSAENLILPATTLARECYSGMFRGCTGLTTAPELPATTLASGCYNGMFRGCTGLTTAPALPATTLASGCYNDMFSGTNVLPDCSNIDFTSNSVVSSGGLIGLFAGTKVTDSDLDRLLPKNTNGKYYLPVTTLAVGCYQGMFAECTSLTTAPELPATTLANSCYNGMFADCTNLVNIPSILPATTLVDYCYYYMFGRCTSLVTAPTLPATTLADSCYGGMFSGCTSLVTAPTLPATTLARECYSGMFRDCTGLTTAPTLPATTLADYCYYEMFKGCTKLNYIKAMFVTTSGTDYTYNWVRGVASTGTFVKNSAATWDVTGVNGIPEGWTVVNE